MGKDRKKKVVLSQRKARKGGKKDRKKGGKKDRKKGGKKDRKKKGKKDRKKGAKKDAAPPADAQTVCKCIGGGASTGGDTGAATEDDTSATGTDTGGDTGGETGGDTGGASAGGSSGGGEQGCTIAGLKMQTGEDLSGFFAYEQEKNGAPAFKNAAGLRFYRHMSSAKYGEPKAGDYWILNPSWEGDFKGPSVKASVQADMWDGKYLAFGGKFTEEQGLWEIVCPTS